VHKKKRMKGNNHRKGEKTHNLRKNNGGKGWRGGSHERIQSKGEQGQEGYIGVGEKEEDWEKEKEETSGLRGRNFGVRTNLKRTQKNFHLREDRESEGKRLKKNLNVTRLKK